MNALTATRPATATGLTASVIIAAYSSERWEYLRAAVASVAAQIRPAMETIVVIDHNPDLLDRARRELAVASQGGDPASRRVIVIPNTRARGAFAGLGMAVAGFAVGGASAALGRAARAARTPRTAAERAR